MRKSARAILITKENKLLLMKRTKPDEVYYVTIGGGIDEGETAEQALIRELKEESGSIIGPPTFAFYYEDLERQNSADFFICHEIRRCQPTGTEWTKWNTPNNQYELVEISCEELKKLPLKPDKIKEKIINIFQKNMHKKPIFYLVCGFLGAGKTTYSQKLAQEKKAIHLNPDEWCITLFDKTEYEKNWNECFSKTIALLWEKAEEYAKQGKSVIFDMGFWTKKSRKEACQKAIALGYSPIIHYIFAPDEVLKKRISKRSGTIADYNLKHFDELKMQFEEPTPEEVFVKIGK